MNWKTTLGGVIFIAAAVLNQVGFVPEIIATNAELVGVLILSLFAKDKR